MATSPDLGDRPAGSSAPADDPAAPSLAGRALVALALTIGFYGLAAAAVGALLYAPYAALVYGHSGWAAVRLGLVGLAGAAAIVSSILPRRTPFEAPGPRLDPAAQPRLFASIAAVAAAMRQRAPDDVYAVPQVNAFVTEVRGRRVMGLGVPLMQVLDRRQFEAVLAHEFGHYGHGDTRLGPWIYRTRAAIGRALHGLQNQGALLRKPFEWYGQTFIRITQRISRQQELAADASAARCFGTAALAGGLRRTHDAALAFDAYWREEVGPVVQAGFVPPLCDGFRRYLASPAAQALRARPEAEADPYDSHPPVAQRVAALGPVLPDGDATPALDLLADLPTLERELWRSTGVDLDAALPLGWSDVDARIWRPQWIGWLSSGGQRLAGVTPATLPEALPALGARVGGEPPTPMVEMYVNVMVGAALALALDRAGWTLVSPLGEPLRFTRGADTMRAFEVAAALRAGDLDADAWRRECAAAGIADVDLGTLVEPAPPAATASGPLSVAPPPRGLAFGTGLFTALFTQLVGYLVLAIPTERVVRGAWRAAGPAAVTDDMLAALRASSAGWWLVIGSLVLGAALAIAAGYMSARLVKGRPRSAAAWAGVNIVLIHMLFRSDLHLIGWVRLADVSSALVFAVCGGWLGMRANAHPQAWPRRVMAPVEWLGRGVLATLRWRGTRPQ